MPASLSKRSRCARRPGALATRHAVPTAFRGCIQRPLSAVRSGVEAPLGRARAGSTPLPVRDPPATQSTTPARGQAHGVDDPLEIGSVVPPEVPHSCVGCAIATLVRRNAQQQRAPWRVPCTPSGHRRNVVFDVLEHLEGADEVEAHRRIDVGERWAHHGGWGHGGEDPRPSVPAREASSGLDSTYDAAAAKRAPMAPRPAPSSRIEVGRCAPKVASITSHRCHALTRGEGAPAWAAFSRAGRSTGSRPVRA